MENQEITLYDISKSLVAQETPMDPILFNQRMIEVGKAMFPHNYLMLLCNDRRDYTIFSTRNGGDAKLLAKEIAECLCNRGKVLLVDLQPDGSWEIWIRDEETNDNFAYYLFDYTDGVIEV